MLSSLPIPGRIAPWTPGIPIVVPSPDNEDAPFSGVEGLHEPPPAAERRRGPPRAVSSGQEALRADASRTQRPKDVEERREPPLAAEGRRGAP